MGRLLLAVPLALLVLGAGFALTAANTVPDHDRADRATSQDADDLKPDACNGITLTTVLEAPNLNGGAANELILGGGNGETITGGGGDDCIMGGGGNDTIDGGLGTNVIIGGPGTDTCLAGSDDCEL